MSKTTSLSVVISFVGAMSLSGCASSSINPSNDDVVKPPQVSVAVWDSKAQTISELVSEADVIILGKVVQAPLTRVVKQELPMMNESGTPVATVTDSMPFSDTLFEVVKTYSGAPPSTLYVMQTGGVTDSDQRTYELADDPFYQLGEEYVLFLVDISGDKVQAPDRELFRVVNPSGRFLVSQDAVMNYSTEVRNTLLPKTLEELESQIVASISAP